MASESIHKQEFIIRNLPTRSVTLFPTRAQIFRDIAGVTLKPGQNQIIIEGLTPTVDEHSIKVDGTGAATITDLSVQLVSNKEIYEEIYPSDDEDSDSEDEDEKSSVEDDAIQNIRKEITKQSSMMSDETEKLNSATARLAMLDKFSNSVEKSPPDDIGKVIDNYLEERIKIYDYHKSASDKINDIQKSIDKLESKVFRLTQAASKAEAKARKAKEKQLAARQRKKNEISKEKARIHAERAKFWPKKVYKLIISLDAPSGTTPATSRRNSIDSMVKVALPGEISTTPSDTSNLGDINISLSYITYSASWLPRYDLALNTVTQSGVLDFQAELRNTTCETWHDAKIVLSTSQTTYQGLDDTIPVMQPWHVRLAKNHYGNGAALYSQNEQAETAKQRNEIPSNLQVPRSEWFGRNDGLLQQKEYKKKMDVSQPEVCRGMPLMSAPQNAHMAFGSARSVAPGESLFQSRAPEHAPVSLFSASNISAPSGAMGLANPHIVAPNPFGHAAGLFGVSNTAAPSGVFGASNFQATVSVPFGGLTAVNSSGAGHFGGGGQNRGSNLLFGQTNAFPAPQPGGSRGGMSRSMLGFGGASRSRAAHYEPDEESFHAYNDEDLEGEADDGATLNPMEANLLFEESSTSETGLTTTYDLPSVKTLAPSSSAIKHKIARLDFRSIVFSHILIPKLRVAAFLKARLRNASKLTLLKGTAGLTLDGSFLGQSTIPRCSAGDSFSLPLGVDPSITVVYAKPTVRRSQSGIFSKEESEVYTRTAVITNTKSNAPVELSVLDQIPVSEDERLKVEIQSPRGLRIGGDSVNAGVGTGAAGSVEVSSGSGSISGSSAAGKARMSVYGDEGAASGKGTAAGKGVTNGKWGTATAVAKKGGEVNWTVVINPLRGCKLLLEYEATYPGGETVIAVN